MNDCPHQIAFLDISLFSRCGPKSLIPCCESSAVKTKAHLIEADWTPSPGGFYDVLSKSIHSTDKFEQKNVERLACWDGIGQGTIMKFEAQIGSKGSQSC